MFERVFESGWVEGPVQHLWNGTMATGKRCDIKTFRLPGNRYEVQWYGSGYRNDSFSPHRMRTDDPKEAIRQVQRLVEEQPQYEWRELPAELLRG